MINNKTFEHRPISELMAIVKNDFKKFDAEGLIDDGTIVSTVLHCNEKLGLTIREVREVAIEVTEFKAQLPLDFEKLYYVCALRATNTMTTTGRNPFDNNFDQDIIHEAELDRQSLGCVENYQVTIKRQTNVEVHTYGNWIQLDLDTNSQKYCHQGCPNSKNKGRYTISIKDGYIETPFRSGTLYLMYIGMMKDADGNITFPFHPLIEPYYRWSVKEKILEDIVFNSDQANVGELYKLATQKRMGAWLDAFNITMERSYGEAVDAQRKKEMKWYNQYFRYFQ